MKSAWKELCNYLIFQWFQSYKSFKSIKSANQQSTGCQRGRRQGRSLKNPPPPRRVWRACQFHRCSSSVPEVLEAQGESAPAAGPYPKVHQKFIKNRVRKKFRISTENGLPQGPSKSQKSHKICKMAPSSPFRELFWPLPFQKGFPSPLQGPP